MQLQRRGKEYRSLSRMSGGCAALQGAMQGPPQSEAHERVYSGVINCTITASDPTPGTVLYISVQTFDDNAFKASSYMYLGVLILRKWLI